MEDVTGLMTKEPLMRMNLQFFADGGDGSAASDMGELDALLNGMSGEEDSTEPEDNADEGTGDEGSTGDSKPEDTDETNQGKPDKAGHAFAQLRTQNAQLVGLLNKIAKATGIEYKDNTDLIAKLNDDTLSKLAKAQNVPVELLQKLERLEQSDQMRQMEQMRSNAVTGFTSLRDAYKLTDDEMRSFAKELDDAQRNPFLQEVDIMAEYKLRHFDDIVKKETARAVEEALKKSSAADRHGSTVPSKGGKPDAGGESKINTMSELDNLLKGMK